MARFIALSGLFCFACNMPGSPVHVAQGQGNLVGQVGDESSHPADMGDWNFDNLLPLGPAINISSPLTDETGSEAEGVGGAPSDDVMHFLQHDMEDDNPRQPKKERVD